MIFQQNKPDEFRHRYLYDADLRLKHVFTSREGIIWDKDASYFYYDHGPLARVELGNQKVQGVDYAYTLHGWIKGINSTILTPQADMGKDAYNGDIASGSYLSASPNIHRWVPGDAAGFTIGYHDEDYIPVSTFTDAERFYAFNNDISGNMGLFNGNISWMATTITDACFFTPGTQNPNPNYLAPLPQLYEYFYDQLNRLRQMNVVENTNLTTENDWRGASRNPINDYNTRYTYDANGNILTLLRNGNSTAGISMDDLNYYYYSGTNRLEYVSDAGAANNYNNDIKSQSAGNYSYDADGNLTSDLSEDIQLITWSVSGKVLSVEKSTGDDLSFRYDAMGNRIAKISKPKATPGNEATWTITWYARDAQGNVLAVYSKQAATNNFSIAEFSIFGSKRIGVVTNPEQLTQPVIDPPTPYSYSFEKGMKQYEFSNHLGNVLSTFTDRKLPQDDFRYDPQPNGDYEYHPDGNFYFYVGAGNGNFIQSPYPDGFIDYYTAQITSATDYYPFGMQIPGRSFTGGEGYRWGFNSMEKDDELKGTGNSYDFGARLYDPRVGRWLAVDPLAGKYPSISSYVFVINSPIYYIDPTGEENVIYLINVSGKNSGLSKADIKKIRDEANKGYERLGVATRVVIWDKPASEFDAKNLDHTDAIVLIGKPNDIKETIQKQDKNAFEKHFKKWVGGQDNPERAAREKIGDLELGKWIAIDATGLDNAAKLWGASKHAAAGLMINHGSGHLAGFDKHAEDSNNILGKHASKPGSRINDAGMMLGGSYIAGFLTGALTLRAGTTNQFIFLDNPRYKEIEDITKKDNNSYIIPILESRFGRNKSQCNYERNKNRPKFQEQPAPARSRGYSPERGK